MTGAMGDAVAEVLDAVWRGDPAVVVSAPPGSGKTGLVERICATSALLAGERVAVATTTNAQMFDVARRVAVAYPSMDVMAVTRKGLAVPSWVDSIDNLTVTAKVADIAVTPGVAIATAAKWAWAQSVICDLLVVDEAWQLSDVNFAQIARLAPRVVLVGDPGQIAPVTPIETQRWAGRPDAPHLPAPQSLLARRPNDITHIRLPATRRLPADTVTLMGDPFYPDLPFVSLRKHTGVRLESGIEGLDTRAASGASIVQVELPGHGGQFDPAVADAIVALVGAATLAHIETDHGWEQQGTSAVGVVCAHVNQVSGIQARLSAAGIDGVLCDTAERLQGLERPIMVVWHPASGRRDVTEFSLDSGRWCVMLSRHTHLAVIVTRTGTAEIYAQAGASTQRSVDAGTDAAHQGWRSHVELRTRLVAHDRVVVTPGTASNVAD